jgi:hypothetical protein
MMFFPPPESDEPRDPVSKPRPGPPAEVGGSARAPKKAAASSEHITEKVPAGDVESEDDLLSEALVRIRMLEQRIAELEGKLPVTGLLSDSFMTRALTVLGHWFVAYMLIVLPFTCLIAMLFAR